MLLLKVSRMCCGNEYGSAFEFYLNKYNKIPEVISEPNLIDYMKQDYRLAFTIFSQSLVMFDFKVYLYNSLVRCNIITLFTGIHNFFMINIDMSMKKYL